MVVVNESCQQLAHLVTGEITGTRTDKEKSFAVEIRDKEVHVATNHVGAETEAVLAVRQRKCVRILIARLRHSERAAIATVLYFVVESANERRTTELRRPIGIHDAQILRLGNIAERIDKAIDRPRGSEPKIVAQAAAEALG